MPDLNPRTIGWSVPVEIIAAKDETKTPTFSMIAYTGGTMRVAGYYDPVALSLKGMMFEQTTPARFQHDANKGVGHTTEVSIVNEQLEASGVISRDTSWARDVKNSSKNGFPWKASIGAHPTKLEWYGEDETVKVNGQDLTGPLYVAWESNLAEISFVDVPADSGTSVEVNANGENIMSEKNEPNKGGQEVVEPKPVEGADEPKDTPVEGSGGKSPSSVTPIQASREKLSEELDRQSAIQERCADSPKIAAQAIREGWSADRAELEMLRQNRPQAPGVIAAKYDANEKVIEAALMMSVPALDKTRVEAKYEEKILDAASRYRRMGLRGLIEAMCAIDGRPCPGHNGSQEEWIEAAFSTRSLVNLTSNVMGKVAAEAFMQVPSLARRVFAKLSASDFKKQTGVRLASTGELQDVGDNGEVKYGTMSDSKFEFEVDTKAEILGYTRKDFKNDDLGLLRTIPVIQGHKAARTVENRAWAFLVANINTFFSSGNSNYQTGADTALGIAGLDKAVQAFAERVDENGDSILIEPQFLVVPPALGSLARQIHASDKLIATGVESSKKVSPSENIHKGSYEPIVVPQIKATPKKWYLFADPNICPAFGIAYLDGIETPTIEEVQPGPEYLGTAFRCVMDFGISQINKEGAECMLGESA